jgi:Trypsin-co-occurring domain 2
MHSRGQPPGARVELAQLIDHVASELLKAEANAAGRSDRVMRFTECQLEMAISIETSGGAGIKVYVLELGGDRSKTNSNTIMVKFQSLPGHELAFPAEGEDAGPELGLGGAG